MKNDFLLEEDAALEAQIDALIFEDCFMEDVQCLPEDVRNEYLESAEVAHLEAARLINGKTRIRMSRSDDLQRRTTLGALMLAKAKKDPLFKKFTFFRAKEKLAKKTIVRKYSNKAAKIAKTSQRNYLKKAPKLAILKNKFLGK